VAYRETGNISHAALLAGVHRRHHYRWLNDPEYAAAFAVAQPMAVGVLLDEAHRRAVEGVVEPAGWFQGEPGGYVRKYSDTLLIFLIKGSSEGYRFRERFEYTGADAAPIEHKALIGVADLSNAELLRMREEALASALPVEYSPIGERRTPWPPPLAN
jgi:hypothetical protein